MSRGTPTFSFGTDSGVYNRVEYTYNQLGERITMKDQNQTVHAYQFDGLGRPTHGFVVVTGSE